MRRPTLTDVARRSYVSVSTASAALSGGSGVSQGTRSRVARAAEDLGYRPNAVARELRAEQRPIVGILGDPALHEGRADSPQVFVRALITGLVDELGIYGAHPMMLRPDSTRPPVDAVIALDVSTAAEVPGWLHDRTPLVVAGVPPLTLAAQVRLGHDITGMSRAVLTELGSGGAPVALVAPWGQLRHLEAFISAYLHWCASREQAPLLLRFDPTPEAGEAVGRRVVSQGAASVFLPTGRCEWSVLSGIRQAGRDVPVVALGEGVVEAAFGPSVGYLSLEGAACAKLIVQAAMDALAGAPQESFIELPWRLAAPVRQPATP